jgi:hypothetical protein
MRSYFCHKMKLIYKKFWSWKCRVKFHTLNTMWCGMELRAITGGCEHSTVKVGNN